MNGDRLPVVLVSDVASRWDALIPVLESRFLVIAVEHPDEIDGLALDRYGVVAEGTGSIEVLRRALDGDPIDAIVLLSPVDDGSLSGREADLASITAPVLIFTGEDDRIASVASVEALGDRLPSSTLGVLPDCGHDLVQEAPETLFPMILEYLRARYAHAPHGHEEHSGLVMLQLERRPEWLDDPQDDIDPAVPDPAEQEVGPSA